MYKYDIFSQVQCYTAIKEFYYIHVYNLGTFPKLIVNE